MGKNLSQEQALVLDSQYLSIFIEKIMFVLFFFI